jgi:hypothetical protein
MGDSFQNDTKGLLLHINLIRNDFVLKPPRNNEKTERRNK